MRTLLLASALFALFGSLAAVPVPVPVPYHAFCRTLWLFETPCVEVNNKLVQQIQAFNPMTGCAECQYKLLSVTPRSIKANHTSPDGTEVEGIIFTLRSTMMGSGCHVSAQSTSIGYNSRLDDGRNYCNLFQLLSASGLTSEKGFTEMTNEWACLGYGLATCNAKGDFLMEYTY